MRFPIRMNGRRGTLAGVCATLGVLAGLMASGGNAAHAATCTTGTPCTMTGTATLGTGTLSLTTPNSLGWTTVLTGAAQNLVDPTAADQALTVNDATGSGAGWNVTVAATTFTNGTSTLADTGTFSVNGDTTAQASTTGPDAVCTTPGDCTVPTGNTAIYPLPIVTAVTAPTPVTLYTSAAGSGLGSVLIGSLHAIGWWLTLPGSVAAGAYTSTIDLNVVSGP
jgi:hypothetical protein